ANSLSDDAVSMLAGEGASFQELREQVARIRKATEGDGLERLRRMRAATYQIWPILRTELGDGRLQEQVELLKEHLDTGAFYQVTPAVDSALDTVEQTYQEVYAAHHQERQELF